MNIVNRIAFQISLHKILTETSHQRRLTNRHECKVHLSSSKFSKISFKQSTGRKQAIFVFPPLQKTKVQNKYKNLLLCNKHSCFIENVVSCAVSIRAGPS